MKKLYNKRNKGFSLVELIIVIAIMAVLIGVLAPQYLGYIKRSKKSVDLQNAENLATAIAVHIADQEAAGADITTLSSNQWKAVATIASLGVNIPAPKLASGRQFYYLYPGGKAVYVGVFTAGTIGPTVTGSGTGGAVTAADVAASAPDNMVYPTIGTGTGNIYK